jgi:DNA mismatch endonuclease Vsr
MDTVTPARRSAIMAAIRSKDTSPELAVRRYLHAAGLRYRLHPRGLPGWGVSVGLRPNFMPFAFASTRPRANATAARRTNLSA